ncbi:MAG: GT2 family glycosyltransferase [Salibacteraceae bacterium]|jgi:GT2 family glycosyltransferase
MSQPRLSVIIVNYNVEYFLAQCLYSVRKAAQSANIETIMVDNNSSDGSVEMTRRLFPEVKVIANKDNRGFSKANNQAIRISQADYVLLLNPDTLVEEDTFKKCIDFMDQHPDSGGLGVKMVDGKGQFLAESKRGLPTPMVAFYKIFGLSNLFPKSATFGQYHLGHLDKDKTHKIDILAGAFMMMRKSVLDKVGLLDEAFFMYGEDIDLSWRIKLGGYENYYFPETRIIHYKGESTKKSSVNYVLVFYNAMIIFAKKHFTKSNAKVFEILIQMAIYFRAGIALSRRGVEKSILPAIDFLTIIFTLFITTTIYGNITLIAYPSEVMNWLYPSYGLIFLISIYLNHGYSANPFINRIIKGVSWGGLVGLLLYGLLDDSYRFSRVIVFMGAVFSGINIILYRWVLNKIGFIGILFKTIPDVRIAIVGKEGGIERVKKLLANTTIDQKMILEVYPSYNFINNSDHFVANLGQLPDACRVFDINQIIYCGEDMDSGSIINEMILQENPEIELKIAPPESTFIIGSQSINTSGEILSIHSTNTFLKDESKTSKRVFDGIISVLFLLLSPIIIWTFTDKWKFIQNLLHVGIGSKTWVGFAPLKTHEEMTRSLKPSIINLATPYSQRNKSSAFFETLNIEYAKKYNFESDLLLIWQQRQNLDN